MDGHVDSTSTGGLRERALAPPFLIFPPTADTTGASLASTHRHTYRTGTAHAPRMTHDPGSATTPHRTRATNDAARAPHTRTRSPPQHQQTQPARTCSSRPPSRPSTHAHARTRTGDVRPSSAALSGMCCCTYPPWQYPSTPTHALPFPALCRCAPAPPRVPALARGAAAVAKERRPVSNESCASTRSTGPGPAR